MTLHHYGRVFGSPYYAVVASLRVHGQPLMPPLPALCQGLGKAWAGSQIKDTSEQPREPSENGSPAVSRPLRKLTRADSRDSRDSRESRLFFKTLRTLLAPPIGRLQQLGTMAASQRGAASLHPCYTAAAAAAMRVASGRRMRPCNWGCPMRVAAARRDVRPAHAAGDATRRDARPTAQARCGSSRSRCPRRRRGRPARPRRSSSS